MIGVADYQGHRVAEVIIGVDTHRDQHVAVAIDGRGVRLGERHVPTTIRGYDDLERWSCSLGEIRAFGIEGTGSYGAGVARFMTGRDHTVIEVNRPDRSVRYRNGEERSHRRRDGGSFRTCRCGRCHSEVRRGRSRDAPYAQEREGLCSQGSHPGWQPDEGPGCDCSCRASRDA